MSQVFISYRQTDDAQKQRVRTFAERLRDTGIDVILDQFVEDKNPAGPSQRWAQWSADRAFKTEYVLIIGTHPYFQCFEGSQPPGTGLGAAYEADAIRQRIYEAGGMNDDIRVVLLDNAESRHIPAELRGYHYFFADRDFEKIVRWLRGRAETSDPPRTSIPHNLPSLQPFFGREEELKRIEDALDPESRTWGALIDGPGGIGKTSLAVRAAYDASSEDFDKIVFVSLKSRELDDEGVRDLSRFLISGLAELLNELARELGHDEIAKLPEDRRPRLLLDALRGTRTLLILDNLESLLKHERDIVFTFVKKLPQGCKAILTSRARGGSAADEFILDALGESAALATLATLAETHPTLAKMSESERLELYHVTGGKPLLLRWTAGQIGRGSCLTLADAIAYLRSCPEENDPLEFIFGDLVEGLSEAETRALCVLSEFTFPAKVEQIIELANCSEADIDYALRSLVNRSLVVPSDELKTFSLVPLVGDFLRRKRPEVVSEIRDRLEKSAYTTVVDNGYDKYDRFGVLDSAWPIIAAALPHFLMGPNDRLKIICDALDDFLNFTGRWDEWSALSRDAERSAASVGDFLEAGWRAHSIGYIHYLRGQSAELFACLERAEGHWREADAGTREKAIAFRLRGLGHQLVKDYPAAISAYRDAVGLLQSLGNETRDVAVALNSLGTVERLSGTLDAAQLDLSEALRIAKSVDYREGVAYITGNLAAVELDRKDWQSAESLARQALSISETIGRQDLIAFDCRRLAEALLRQGKKTEGLPYANRAVDIFTRLGSREITLAKETLAEFQSEKTSVPELFT
jgi:tetratricopeptide (TPR) repeat protein